MNRINSGTDDSSAPWSSVFLSNGFCSATANNCGGRGHRYFETSHYSSCNRGLYHSSDVGIIGSRSFESSHSLSLNRVTILDVEMRCGYRYQTSHFYYHSQGDRGRLLTSPVSSYSVEEKVHKK